MNHLNFNSNTENKDEWLTPPELIESLGKFDLDPCSPVNRPWNTASKHLTINNDGLKSTWEGRIWLNPPYGRKTFEWIEKLYQHGNGVALTFARTETIGFHSTVWEKADSIFFFKGRLKFYHVTGEIGGAANAPSCLIAYGKNNTKFLKCLNLPGKFINLHD